MAPPRRDMYVLGDRQRRRSSDERGHLAVLEAVMVAALLIGAAAYVALAPRPGQSGDAAEAQMSALARDSLQVLEGRPASSAVYRSALHEYVTEAILGDPSGLTSFMDGALPEGADWGVYLDNGEGLETIHETGTPTGEVVSETMVFYPDWNYALVFATMDRQPGASVTTGSTVTTTCTLPPVVVCTDTTTPTTTASAIGSMKVKVVPVKHTYLDRTASGSIVFDNGRSFPLTPGSDHVLATAGIVPESPTVANGFETPYDTASEAAYASSVTTSTAGAPRAYGVNTTLPYATRTPIVYRVHPSYVADAALQTFLDAQPRVTAAKASYKPGQTATVAYDFAGLPLQPGWSVQSREVVVYGPVLGNTIKTESLPALGGDWTWALPRNLLYGTYTVEVRLGLVNGGVVQTVHDVTAFDVLRRGVDGPVPPVYHAVLAVWFNSA